MRSAKFSFCCVLALLFSTLVSANSSAVKFNCDIPRPTTIILLPRPMLINIAPVVGAPAPQLSPDSLAINDSAYQKAYADAYNILRAQNSCSQFFRGPVTAVEAFNQLAQRITKDYLAPYVGLRMSGSYVLYTDYKTGATYRLFNRQVVNVNGPFYRHENILSRPRTPDVGSFPASTRPARALLLLHELGHLLIGPDGHWLLPNDGDDPALSEQNTWTVEKQCGAQLRELK